MRDQAHRQSHEGEAVVHSSSANCLLFRQRESEQPSAAEANLMAQTSRTFRIFVSSTFSDLKEERNALQQHVFPRLRELRSRHGCRFQAIDLRWGIKRWQTRSLHAFLLPL